MNDTCILVTTFLRDDLLLRCLKSIRKYYPSIPLYVGDNGDVDDKKRHFCKKLNATLIELDFDLGVGGVRNESIARIPKKYKYIYICEDDIVFTEHTKIEVLSSIIKSDSRLGIVGGLLKRANNKEQHYEANVRIEGDTKYCHKVKNPEWIEHDETPYYLCDLILNVFLMRRAVWDDVKWDAQFKTALEHADFFLRLQYDLIDGKAKPKKKAWRVAYAPSVWAYHKSGGESERFRQFRDRPVGFRLFARKWGIHWSYSDYNLKNPINYDTFGNFVLTEKDLILDTAARILTRLKAKWWLMSGTLLGAVREGGFIEGDTDIDIGIGPKQLRLWEPLKREFKREGFELYKEWLWEGKKIELTFTRNDVKIDFFFHYENDGDFWYAAFGPDRMGRWGKFMECVPRVHPKRFFEDLREVVFRGVRCFLPNPAEDYLARHYGKDWRTPDKDWKYWRDNQAIDTALFKPERTVFISHIWDCFSIKHLNLIEDAKKLGTRLVVGVLTDDACYGEMGYTPKSPFSSRKRIIESLNQVDEVVCQAALDPTRDLQKASVHPDYIIATDADGDCPGREFVEIFGGKVIHLPWRGESGDDIRRRFKVRVDRIGVVIKTFMREDNFFRSLDSVKQNLSLPYTLYIGDDGPISEAKEYRYTELEEKGHTAMRLPFNVGLSSGRNSLVKAVKEKYVLIMDDDILLTDPAAVQKMKAVLDSDASLGIVAGVLHQEQSGAPFGNATYSKGVRLDFRDGMLYREPSKKILQRTGEIEWLYADQVINFFLAKRKVFEQITWDSSIKVAYEHMDFFIELKKHTDWKCAVCLDAKATHAKSGIDLEYERYRRAAPLQRFLQKHHIHRIIERWH